VSRDAQIAVYGAGAIGCYVGGRLAAAGSQVVFIGRARMAAELRASGLTLTSLAGIRARLAPEALHYATDPAAARTAKLVLVTVKSADTEASAQELARVLTPGTTLLSLQNGLHNAKVLQCGLPEHTVVPGMVPFNVVARAGGVFHQATEGVLEAEQHPALQPFLEHFDRSRLTLRLRAAMEPVLWAKLLLNLNNPINALADIPLKTQLEQRDFRRCLAHAQAEALALLHERGIRPARLTPLPAAWIPRLLDVPDALFRTLGARMLAIDPLARSSMWEDLERGRKTEVDYINGEVVRLAAHAGRAAPVNARLVALIRAAERGGRRRFSGAELLAELSQG
jgi:2-dehydropantoate 2-reductase